ncbi:MAG: hypothetical protein WDM90_13845 [Ferruginibacter sp.]
MNTDPDNKLDKQYGRGKNKYKVKGSLALLDIGAITYKKSTYTIRC